MDQELMDIALRTALRDSEATGDRFVPMSLFNGSWAVLDAHNQLIISRDHSFESALKESDKLSREWEAEYFNELVAIEQQKLPKLR